MHEGALSDPVVSAQDEGVRKYAKMLAEKWEHSVWGIPRHGDTSVCDLAKADTGRLYLLWGTFVGPLCVATSLLLARG